MNYYNFDSYTKEELVSLLEQLSLDENIHQKIQILLSEPNKILQEYKGKMEELFFPPFGMPISNLKISDQLVAEYYEKTNDKTLEFKMYYVEILVEFLQTFGLMGNSFFQYIIEMYTNICASSQGKNYTSRLEHILQVMIYMDPTCEEVLKEALNKLNI
ncbi:MAG: hypothetical protein KBT48_05345 [Firmicutes bacterium]|nr:hypothetical protein [Bacillota bacterium]